MQEPKKERRWSILPVPTIDYTPETGPSVGAVALLTLRPWDDTRPSTVKLEGTVTWKKQVILETGWQIYTRRDQWLIAGSIAGMRYPERFWGIGPDSYESAGEDYDAWRLEIAPELLWRAWRDLFVGPSYHFHSMFAITPAPGGLLDTAGITGADGGIASGIGYAVQWDTRENASNPVAGSRYLSLRHHFFTPETGGDYGFTRALVDGRIYLKSWREHVLALQAVADLHSGDPPFRMLAMLGGDTITRGYWYGRKRDQHLLAIQAEYRAPIWWRFGAVVFGGVGEITPDLAEHDLAWLAPTVGGGIRVRLIDDENLNLRFDYAHGIDSYGVYFGFGEVF